MKNQVNRLLQTALAVCCLVVASCQQAPPAQVEAEYEVMTIAPADRTLTSVYSATIRGRQDIEIYPQVSGFLTKVCVTEGEHVRGRLFLSLTKWLTKLLCRQPKPM